MELNFQAPIMQRTLIGILSLVFILLTACGSDGDSSSGGGAAQPETNPISGTFTGTQTVTVTVTGSGITVTETETVAFRMDVNSAGNTATVVDADFQAAGPIVNGQFAISADSPFTEGTLTCTGVTSYTGSVAPTDTNGDVSAVYTCSDTTLPGVGLSASLAGTFTGSKQNAKQAIDNRGIHDAISNAVFSM
ncbi:MAG TPA: hypothetical protein DCY55_09790 [Gammaproteobacteria bacterium]|nr:hypothetical protein [Gammaproteobacteria bacterium]